MDDIKINFIKENYKYKEYREIANILGIKPSNVAVIVSRLGLRKIEKWNKEKIIERLQLRAKELGHSPSFKELDSNLLSAIYLHFTKFNVAKKNAGLNIVEAGNPVIIKRSEGLTVNKAYLLGVLCGDGIYGHYGVCYVTGLSTIDKDFIYEFERAIQREYGVTIHRHLAHSSGYRQGSIYRSVTQSKKIYENLYKYAPFNTYKWRVPIEILDSESKPIKIAFLKGYVDSEASVCPDRPRVQMTSVNKDGLEDVSILLKSIGINNKIYVKEKYGYNPRRVYYSLEIGKTYYVKIFLDEIGFSIKRKEHKLKKVINKCKYPIRVVEYTKALELHNKYRWSAQRISTEIGIPRSTVSAWIYGNVKPENMK